MPLAVGIAKAIGKLLSDKVMTTLEALRSVHPTEWTMLPGFTFTAEELVDPSGIALDAVTKVLDAFCLPSSDRNTAFTALHEFNSTNALPLLRNDKGEFVLLQYYSLVEAIYESPFYWMCTDKAYAPAALTIAVNSLRRFAESA